jgi:REP element-mobilizing transposase RayT
MNSTRRLPHIYPEGRWIFLTWHLHGALRPSQFQPPGKASSGEAFVLMDRELDKASQGPTFLRQDAIASLIEKSLYWGEEVGNYDLSSWVVMANHVHALLLPKILVSALMKSLKGYTAREANKLLGRTGTPFWQKESYDHWVRDQLEWERIKSYIENNPVKAGLASSPDQYRWSSARNVDTNVDAARLEARATFNG